MANVYLEGMKAIHNGGDDLLTGTIRALLLTDGTVATFDETSSFVTQVLAEAGNTEATDASYTGQGATGRLTLGTKSVNEAGGKIDFTAAKLTWTALDSFTVSAAVVFFFVSADSDSEAISFHNFTDKAANGSDFEVRWSGTDGNGIVFTVDNS